MRRFLLPLAGVLLLSGLVSAYIRSQDDGVIIAWSSGSWPLSFVICSQDTSGATVSDEDKLALRLCFQSWEDDSGSLVDFTEDTSSTSQALHSYTGLDASHHLILFDPDNSSGLFSAGTVAITPIYYNSVSGVIADADIVLNSDAGGIGFTFSSSAVGVSAQMDIQDVITHEVGHFIGLDHSPVGGATMFPFVDYAEVAKRSLSSDDLAGAAIIRPPASATTGTITGTVFRSNGTTPISHPIVYAVDSNGNIASQAYGDTSGAYTLTNLAAGNYTVYAAPYLDDFHLPAAPFQSNTLGLGFMTTDSLSDTFANPTSMDGCKIYSMTFYGGNPSPSTLSVSAGSNTAAGSLTCNAPISGVTFTGFSSPQGDPFLVVRGSSGNAIGTFMGAGFSGYTASVSNPGTPDLTVSGQGGNGTTTLTFNVAVGSSAALGMRDVRLTSGSNMMVYPGIVEVVQAAPNITSLDVSAGTADGGTAVVISGTGFQGTTSTMKVTFGGALATITNITSTAVSVTTPASCSGTVDVGVINPDGQGAVASAAFTFDPVITSVSNQNLCATAETNITITGAGFQSGATVLVDSTAATNVSVVSCTRITCKTPGLGVGTHDLTVINPDLGTTTSADLLNYIAQCGGGGGGCFSVKEALPPGPGDRFGLFLPYLLLLAIIGLLRKKRVSLA